MATATKGTWVANLVEPWNGYSNSIPVNEFFESINETAKMGRMSSKDRLTMREQHKHFIQHSLK
jgi:hypothetical protein